MRMSSNENSLNYQSSKITPIMPVSYLACGGLDRAFKFPSSIFSALRSLERPFDRLGMFALIVIEKKRHDC